MNFVDPTQIATLLLWKTLPGNSVRQSRILTMNQLKQWIPNSYRSLRCRPVQQRWIFVENMFIDGAFYGLSVQGLIVEELNVTIYYSLYGSQTVDCQYLEWNKA